MRRGRAYGEGILNVKFDLLARQGPDSVVRGTGISGCCHEWGMVGGGRGGHT